jgi:hypothetical protein
LIPNQVPVHKDHSGPIKQKGFFRNEKIMSFQGILV